MSMHIGHLALRVTDPERSATFLETIMGLRRTHEADGSIFLSTNEKHHEIELHPGDTAGVDHLGLEVDTKADLDKIRAAVEADGAEIVSDTIDEAGIKHGFRVLTPIGAVFEVYTDMEREPLSIANYMPPLARRFGHVSFGTPDPLEMERFLCDVLGFRVTDRLFDRCWMRCDTDHHGVAVFDSEERPTFMHHYAFQLEDWSVVHAYCDRLAHLKEALVWGPGRHGPGRNIYTYLADRDNIIVEGYTDLVQVLNEDAYEAQDWTGMGKATLNLWGPGPPEGWRDFGVPMLAPQTTTKSTKAGVS